MKYRNLHILIYILSICTPIGFIQLYLINDRLLPILLITITIITLLYVVVLIYGLYYKKRVYILTMPLYIFTFFIFFKIVQFQDKSNIKKADNLILLIEEYKKDNHGYPNSLTQLEGKYINSVPKIWRGLIPSDYLYYFDTINNSFSLTHKFGKHGGKTWQSSMGSWDYYGD